VRAAVEGAVMSRDGLVVCSRRSRGVPQVLYPAARVWDLSKLHLIVQVVLLTKVANTSKQSVGS